MKINNIILSDWKFLEFHNVWERSAEPTKIGSFNFRNSIQIYKYKDNTLRLHFMGNLYFLNHLFDREEFSKIEEIDEAKEYVDKYLVRYDFLKVFI